MFDIPLQAVESSCISFVGHDAKNEILRVIFTSGSEYRYYGVTNETYLALMESPSIGAYFNQHIKPHHRCVSVVVLSVN